MSRFSPVGPGSKDGKNKTDPGKLSPSSPKKSTVSEVTTAELSEEIEKMHLSHKISILGSGNVAQTIAKGLIGKGFQVTIGSRDPNSDKLQKFLSENGSNAKTATPDEAAKVGDIVILATSWNEGKAVEEALKLAGSENLKGKIVIDATNPLKWTQETGLNLDIGHTTSGGEFVQALIPEARVVKALNTIGCEQMVNPPSHGAHPTMFIAGNDAEAKKTVTDLLKRMGWKSVVDSGDIKKARLLEPVAMLWISYMIANGHRAHSIAFLNAKQ